MNACGSSLRNFEDFLEVIYDDEEDIGGEFTSEAVKYPEIQDVLQTQNHLNLESIPALMQPSIDTTDEPSIDTEISDDDEIEDHVNSLSESIQQVPTAKGLVVNRRRGIGRGKWPRFKRNPTIIQDPKPPLVERYIFEEDIPGQLRQSFNNMLDQNKRKENIRRDKLAEVDGILNKYDIYDDEELFVWLPMDSWQGSKETFLPEISGPTRIFDTAYNAFRAYWDDNILSHISHETNQYAQTIQRERFQRSWYETNLDEILLLFAFWIMLGIIKMPTIKSCFSKIAILRTDVFRQLFNEARYWDLNASFQISNGLSDPQDPTNFLYPMGPVINHLNDRFKQLYKLEQNIYVEESTTVWKSKMQSSQDINTYQLCETSSGYLWSLFVYTGTATLDYDGSASVSIVLKLVEPLLNLGYVLHMGSSLNSPLLARCLKRNRTDCVGTLRHNIKNVPPSIQKCTLGEGEFIARQSGDVVLLALQDKKRMTYISTFHDTSQVQSDSKLTGRSLYKLKLIEDCNQGMGGVDRLDQTLEPYLIERMRCIKWTKKLFKRLVNITIRNAQILVEKSTNTKIDSFAFRLSLVEDIINKHIDKVPRSSPANGGPVIVRQRNPKFPISRLTDRHFICRIPITEEMRNSNRHRTNIGRRNCVWCRHEGRRSKTSYECPDCQMALCLESCFKNFHTIP